MFLNTDFLKSDEIYLKLHTTTGADKEKGYVPAYHFNICTLNGVVVGECDLRIGRNELLYYGGNIGYNVKKEHRGNHFAGKACKLLFALAKKHGFDYLYITCNPENTASKKTCEYLGCTLEGIVDVPKNNELYLSGEKRKCIYKYVL